MNATTLLLTATGTLGLAIFGLLAGLWFMGIDRVLAARMQARIGPPIRQPFIDMAKLMVKQNVVPANAIPWLFNGAPLLALASAITILLYIPMAALPGLPVLNLHGDLVLIMYLLLIPGLAMVAGGLSSGSPYATIGAQREMVTMIAYELPLASTIIAFAWKLAQLDVATPFSLASVAATPIWTLVGPVGFMGLLLLLATMILVAPGELGRIPFDAPEAETEIAGGLLVEYSGRNLALFSLSLAVKTIVVTALIVGLFFPWNFTDIVAITCCPFLAAGANILFFLLKLFVVLFFSVTLIRISVARFRITQVVDVYWKVLGALSIVGLILVMVDARI
ncbi:MAG: NADH-quinone oxidoreductase subunit H [Kiritimatiellae bacterium]|jgi:formate hydrogenlyase subunit 4|nr:NADH-quinone oxidoreductase subunit H [Kiritimatiellia bacterium]NLD90475.1 NADH-quinone oxidoreductase subunit H [Lentisphaerota bacterium]HPC20529.1 NADH-quinone oxidoreductase subunit H [Kiritimatiellia bacterium]HQQ61580.1 NADH-quinone oxidoreductase subunit H [Kiritimatiellia bacterium]